MFERAILQGPSALFPRLERDGKKVSERKRVRMCEGWSEDM